MANDSQRDKARAIFGNTFFENSKALPNPKNAAAALQKRANDRPIPTYKVGGVVKKPTPPQPTAAERESDRRFRESIAKEKVTKAQGKILNRIGSPATREFKDGGKAMAGAKRAMKAEQDFTGLMKTAAERAAAKGTPVMKQGGATDEYTAKRVMSRIKAGNFKDGGVAQSRYDRRLKDIEKDFAKAMSKKTGKAAEVAEAKRAQRIADAKDDLAKRTGGDRTATRAAERAAESNLVKTRKYGAVKAVTEAPEAKVMDTMSALTAPKSDLATPAAAPKKNRPATAKKATVVRKVTTAPPAASSALGVSNLPSDQGFNSKSKNLKTNVTKAVAKPAASGVSVALLAPKGSTSRSSSLGDIFKTSDTFKKSQQAKYGKAPESSNSTPAAKPAASKASAALLAPKGSTSRSSSLGELFKTSDAFRKSQQAKYGKAAGGAAKVRKGMMKGK